jgi:hypothetical protein
MQRTAKHYYVYTLAYPDGAVFYVGKGAGDRINTHERDARAGNCLCRKCIIIRKIWKSGKKVKAEIVVSALSSSEALQEERRLIGELSQVTDLCNKTLKNPRIDVVRTIGDMPLDEAMAAIKQMRVSENQRKRIINQWVTGRMPELQQRWRTARQQHWYDRAATIEQEIEAINAMIGNVFQNSF